MAGIIFLVASVFVVADGVAPPAVVPPPARPAILPSTALASQGAAAPAMPSASSAPSFAQGSPAQVPMTPTGTGPAQPPRAPTRTGLSEGELMEILSKSQSPTQAQTVHDSTALDSSLAMFGGFFLAALSAVASVRFYTRRSLTAGRSAALTEMPILDTEIGAELSNSWPHHAKFAMAALGSETSSKYDPAGLADVAQTRKFEIEHGRVVMMEAAGGMSTFGLPQHDSPQKDTGKTQFSPAVAAAAAIPTLLSNVLPALAEEIDSSEAYNRKVMTGAAYCLTLSFILLGIVISQARKLVENKWLN